MPVYRKISGKHHYRKGKQVICIKPGETIECDPEFLGGSISTFEKISDGKLKENAMKKEELEEIEKDAEEEAEKKDEAKKKKKKKEKFFKRKPEIDE